MKDACSSQQSGAVYVSVGFGGCLWDANKSHLPASLGLSPILSAFLEIDANQCWEHFSPGRTSSSPARPGLTWSRTKELSGHGSAQAVNAQLHFFSSSAKISFFSALCYWGFYSCSHPPSTFCTANSCFSPSVWLCNPWLVSNQPFSMVMNGLTFCFLMSNRKNVSELSKNNWN